MSVEYPSQRARTETLRLENPGAAANADATRLVGRAPFAGTVTAVRYMPDTDLTGADTESRTLQVHNRGADGDGTTKGAETAFEDGVNAAQYDEAAITVITAGGADVVAEGDVLTFTSLHVGSTGLADPGGAVEVDVTRDPDA